MIRASVLILFCVAPAAAAQTTVTLMHDNDEWAHTDQEYSEGSRLSVVNPDWGKAPLAQSLTGFLPGIAPGDHISAGFGAGHYFYVPLNIATTAPIANQRPYAGWLHASGLLIAEGANHQDTWKLDAGVVGPSALSEDLEKFFHNIFSGRAMNGWDNQITDRFAANLSWQRRWRNIVPVGPLALDISPVIGLEAGTISTAASAGLTLRFGADLDADFGAPRAGPDGGSLSRQSRPGWSAYAFASANARYQAYDIFLDEPGGEDGEPIRAGSAITRGKTRNEASLGFVIATAGARFTFAYTDESKRYDQQADRQRYGEVTVGWSF